MTDTSLRETPVNVEILSDLHGKIKAILNSDLSDGAKFAALAEAVGARGAEEIAAVVKKPIRTVERHYAELRRYRQLRRSAGTHECVVPQNCVEKPAKLRTEIPQNSVPPSCAGATKESPSEIVITSLESEVKKEKKGSGLSASALPPLDPLHVFNTYNLMALELGLAIARSLSPSRRKSIGARLREHGADSWETVLANIRRSAFLQGRNERGWRMQGLDWLIGPENYVKVLEGQYGNGAHAKYDIRSNSEFQRQLEAI